MTVNVIVGNRASEELVNGLQGEMKLRIQELSKRQKVQNRFEVSIKQITPSLLLYNRLSMPW